MDRLIRGLRRPLGLPAPPGCWFRSPPPSPHLLLLVRVGVPLPGSLPQLQTGPSMGHGPGGGGSGRGVPCSRVAWEAFARGQGVPARTRGCASAGSMAPCPPTSLRGRASSTAASGLGAFAQPSPLPVSPASLSATPAEGLFSCSLPSPYFLCLNPHPGLQGALIGSVSPQHNSHNRRTFQKVPCVLSAQTGPG